MSYKTKIVVVCARDSKTGSVSDLRPVTERGPKVLFSLLLPPFFSSRAESRSYDKRRQTAGAPKEAAWIRVVREYDRYERYERAKVLSSFLRIDARLVSRRMTGCCLGPARTFASRIHGARICNDTTCAIMIHVTYTRDVTPELTRVFL